MGRKDTIETAARKIRIGYIGGQPKRLNERIIDNQWIQYLGEYTELVSISPLKIFKLFNGSIKRWIQSLPQSLHVLSADLADLCKQNDMKMIYFNLPQFIPYLLMARNYSGLDVGLLFLTHSVGSEYWMKQWIAIAPWLTERDVLLTSTASSRKALLRISDRFQLARHIPLCIALQPIESEQVTVTDETKKHLLSIGRIEDVKNIHVLLHCFAKIQQIVPGTHLTIAGEYTGQSEQQIRQYRQTLEQIVEELSLESAVSFIGPVEGEMKAELFRRSELLINLSTDPGETFGFNLIEAKIWGLPVVCAKWDGFQEVVVHGVDGYLVDCDWEQEQPTLDTEQIVQYSVNLLEDEDLQKRFSSQAKLEASAYDYKKIMPYIVSEARNASMKKIQAVPQAAQIAQSNLLALPDIYHVENLLHLPFSHHPLVSMPLSESAESLNTWIPKAKPVIHHFAGR
ncbi:glycosyltransferase [Paenibacillus sp. GCM10027628]|uniref:glycosyltransferase n=1 Tax=Paenibacillus sp. GCM10027628 TaxID=3273413 RepID=UPI00362D7CA6